MKFLAPVAFSAAMVSSTANEYCAGRGIFCQDAEFVSGEIVKSGISQIVAASAVETASLEGAYLPVVQMHGMGDFAKNPGGMVPLAKSISSRLNGAYVTNVQIGDNFLSDMLNGFLMNMDDQVDYFAKTVAADPELAAGFNAVGYSQGNIIIRGYVERYNSPPVFNWISMHGTLAGVAGLPKCAMTSTICRWIDDILHLGAYIPFVQDHLAQANYLRDPMHLDQYRQGARFLPDLNNEKTGTNGTYVGHFTETLNKMVCVMAEADTMVVPKESEHWGFFADSSQTVVQAMEDTQWYTGDLFGLKTLHQAQGVDFDTTPGDHLQFDTEYLLSLVDTYFTGAGTAAGVSIDALDTCPSGQTECTYLPGKTQCCLAGEMCIANVGCRC